MPIYTATQRYRSGLGQFAAGETVDLPEDFAAHINRDAPGTLKLTTDEPEATDESDEPEATDESEARQVDEPPADRMVRQARRRDRQGDPGDQGPITRDDFKAVKGEG